MFASLYPFPAFPPTKNFTVNEEYVDEIIVYKWNRVYPADFYCEIDFGAFNIVSELEFQGSSHDKITKIVYSR